MPRLQNPETCFPSSPPRHSPTARIASCVRGAGNTKSTCSPGFASNGTQWTWALVSARTRASPLGGVGPRAHVKPRTHNCVIQVVHIHIRARSQAGIPCAFPSSILIPVTAMQPAMTCFIRPRFAKLSLVCPFFANESPETRRGDRTRSFHWTEGGFAPRLSTAILHRTPTTARLKHPSKHICLSTFPISFRPQTHRLILPRPAPLFTSAPARARSSNRMINQSSSPSIQDGCRRPRPEVPLSRTHDLWRPGPWTERRLIPFPVRNPETHFCQSGSSDCERGASQNSSQTRAEHCAGFHGHGKPVSRNRG
jgi:hypothetical protein